MILKEKIFIMPCLIEYVQNIKMFEYSRQTLELQEVVAAAIWQRQRAAAIGFRSAVQMQDVDSKAEGGFKTGGFKHDQNQNKQAPRRPIGHRRR